MLMIVPPGAMIDPKKAGFMSLAHVSTQVQSAYNFVIKKSKDGNYKILARIYNSLVDDYMIERRGDKMLFTTEDEVTTST